MAHQWPVAIFIVLLIREWGGTGHIREHLDIPNNDGVEVTNLTSTDDFHSCEFHSMTTSTPISNFHFHYFLLYSIHLETTTHISALKDFTYYLPIHQVDRYYCHSYKVSANPTMSHNRD